MEAFSFARIKVWRFYRPQPTQGLYLREKTKTAVIFEFYCVNNRFSTEYMFSRKSRFRQKITLVQRTNRVDRRMHILGNTTITYRSIDFSHCIILLSYFYIFERMMQITTHTSFCFQIQELRLHLTNEEKNKKHR